MIARIVIQAGFTILWAFVVAVLITLLSHLIGPYSTPLLGVIINNALIFGVVNLLLTAILESWLFFIENNRAKLKAELLERELSQIRFEILKSQINPHFMFNSLNVLSGLIDSDVVKAQLFIDEFSQIYRYVLETIEKPVVTLKEELDFIRSYFFLQQIRYGEALTLTVDLPANLLGRHVPPLSLQTLLENAIKHNIVSKEQPLQIVISNDEEWLIAKNNVQSKISSGASTGLGQNNLVKRYSLIDLRVPGFTMGKDYYTVRLPLINTEK
jgi:LytS/YehU family sensor histidine kinase